MKKDFFDILENADDGTIEMIENKYPVLNDKKTEQLLEMSLKKMNEMKGISAPFDDGDEMKTECITNPRRPILHRITGLAAMVALVAGGTAVYMNLPHHSEKPDPTVSISTTTTTTETTTTQTTTTETTTTETTTITTTTPAETTTTTPPFPEYNEYAEIVKELTAQYEDLLNITTYGTSFDENDAIFFNVYPSEESLDYVLKSDELDYDEEYKRYQEYLTDSQYGKYCRNTDERFNSIEDLEAYARSIVSERLFDKLFAQDHKRFENDFIDGLAGYVPGDSVDNYETTDFTMYEGKLYVHAYTRTNGSLPVYWADTPITITDLTDESFVAYREWSEYKLDGTDDSLELYTYKYLFVKDKATGEWRIDEQIWE